MAKWPLKHLEWCFLPFFIGFYVCLLNRHKYPYLLAKSFCGIVTPFFHQNDFDIFCPWASRYLEHHFPKKL